jgi:hypothetical protein
MANEKWKMENGKSNENSLKLLSFKIDQRRKK